MLSISNDAECYLRCERFLVPYRSITLQSLTQRNSNVRTISASTVRSEGSGDTVVAGNVYMMLLKVKVSSDKYSVNNRPKLIF